MKYLRHIERQTLFFVFSFIVTFLFLSIPLNTANADDMNPGVYAIDSKPFGASYGEWIARFVNWSAQIPEPVHLSYYYTPEKCSMNQTGPVWFLAETFSGIETRSCTIPHDKAILLPTMSGVRWTDTTDPAPISYDDLLRDVRASNENATKVAKLDGMEIKNLNQYRAHSPPFNITVVEDNVWDGKAGTWLAAADGFFVFLEPLPVGKHTLETVVDLVDPKYPSRNYAAILTYQLNIVK